MKNLINNFNNSVSELIKSINDQYDVQVSTRDIFEKVRYCNNGIKEKDLNELVIEKVISRLNYKISQYAYFSTSYQVGYSDVNQNLSLAEQIIQLNNQYLNLLQIQQQRAIEYAAKDFENKTLKLSSACEWLYDWNLKTDRYDISYQLEPACLNLFINHFFGIDNAYPTDTKAWSALRKTELKHDLLNVKCYKNGKVKISKK